jgi:threonine/homoserine efflux transporter RhtA
VIGRPEGVAVPPWTLAVAAMLSVQLEVLAAAVGLALLLPVLPFALEMLALRRMTSSAFGTLMALEPAMGLLLGLLVLAQQPSTASGMARHASHHGEVLQHGACWTPGRWGQRPRRWIS